jgi:hypothetical protein
LQREQGPRGCGSLGGDEWEGEEACHQEGGPRLPRRWEGGSRLPRCHADPLSFLVNRILQQHAVAAHWNREPMRNGERKRSGRIVGMLTAITFSVWGRKANPSGGTWSTQAGCRAWFDWVTTVGASIGLGAFSILNASRCII